LNRAERLVLQSETDLGLGWDTVQLAAWENYYAYSAGTRASERLCVSWSRRGLDGKSLRVRPSPNNMLTFVGAAGRRRSPGGRGDPIRCPPEDVHRPLGAGNRRLPSRAAGMPPWDRVLPENYPAPPVIGLAGRTAAVIREQLLPAAGEAARRLEETALARLYPEKILYSSVSALETFAQCPFRHFAGQQLRLKERDEFQADTATLGTLLHAILHRFHTVTREEQRQWREWVPEAAATRIRELGEELLATPEFARQSQDPLVRWESEQKIEGLAVAVEQMITRFATYSFAPVLSEFQFRDQPAAGGPARPAPAWPIPLREGRTLKLQGSLDRLDVYRTPDGEILVSIYDYKSGRCELNEKWLQNGLELQLLSYLAFAVESDELKAAVVGLLANEGSGAPILQPAGAFNIPLSPQIKSAKRNASDDEHQREFLKTLAYHGRADKQWRPSFDSSAAASEVQQFSASHFKSSDVFAALLHTRGPISENTPRRFSGRRWGAAVRFSNQRTACDYCPFRSLCRV
jgi:ATP-dependent helicase/nuclease subunit B